MRGTGVRRLVGDCTSGTRQRRHHTGSGDEVRNSAAGRRHHGGPERWCADRKLASVFCVVTVQTAVAIYDYLTASLYLSKSQSYAHKSLPKPPSLALVLASPTQVRKLSYNSGY